MNSDYMHDKLDVEMWKVHPSHSLPMVCLWKCLWKGGNPPDRMEFWQYIKKLNVETCNSIWNHKFWLHAQKIGCGNVQGLSNLIIINGLSMNLPVETWKTHSTLSGWKLIAPKKFDNPCGKLNMETWKST